MRDGKFFHSGQIDLQPDHGPSRESWRSCPRSSSPVSSRLSHLSPSPISARCHTSCGAPLPSTSITHHRVGLSELTPTLAFSSHVFGSALPAGASRQELCGVRRPRHLSSSLVVAASHQDLISSDRPGEPSWVHHKAKWWILELTARTSVTPTLPPIAIDDLE